MDVLIIRSTHLEHLDLVLEVVRRRFPAARVSLFTHSHAAKSIGEGVSVITYKGWGDFSIFKISPLHRRFDLIVVPFNNETGAGYLNVILLAFALRARLRMSCNINGKLAKLGYGYLAKRLFVAIFISLLAIIGTVFALPLILFVGSKIRDARVSI